MPIIRANTPIVTQINVSTVPDGQQQPLIDYLSRATQAAREVDGCESAPKRYPVAGGPKVLKRRSKSLDRRGPYRHRSGLPLRGQILSPIQYLIALRRWVPIRC